MIHFQEKVSIKRPWMEGWTSCVILKIDSFLKIKIFDEAPTNKGSEGSRHVEKVIHFQDKVSMKRT